MERHQRTYDSFAVKRKPPPGTQKRALKYSAIENHRTTVRIARMPGKITQLIRREMKKLSEQKK
jgi:hypothetical protein